MYHRSVRDHKSPSGGAMIPSSNCGYEGFYDRLYLRDHCGRNLRSLMRIAIQRSTRIRGPPRRQTPCDNDRPGGYPWTAQSAKYDAPTHILFSEAYLVEFDYNKVILSGAIKRLVEIQFVTW